MLTYVFILIVLGAGVTGWMGYQSGSLKRSIRKRSAERNQWLKMHALARKTDEDAKKRASSEGAPQ